MIATLTMNPALDKSTSAKQVVPDRKLRCEIPRFEPGGGGVNVARAIKKMGGSARAVYPAGGHTGRLFRELLEKEGVEQRVVEVSPLTRESLMVVEESSGQQYRFTMPGSEISEEEWRRCLEAVEEFVPAPDYLVASGSLPPGAPEDFYGRLANLCREREIRLIVDTSGAALESAAEAGVYLLKPNMRELSDLVGSEVQGEEEQERAARELIEKGGNTAILLSLGAAGALLVTEETCARLRAPSVPIKSKVGAGDSTVAGVVLALDRGEDLLNAALHGIAAGAAAVMTPGSELCRGEDVDRLYRRLKKEGADEC